MGILETIVSVALFVLIAAAQEGTVESEQPQKCAGCLPRGPEPDCKDSKKYPLAIYKKQKGKDCVCPEWTCIWRDCSDFNFHQDQPIPCDDCAEPKVEMDCGCKKWVCKPKVCSDVEKIVTCPDPCKEVVTHVDKCNCPEYRCEFPKPPVEENCKVDSSICTKCQTCLRVPIISEECTVKYPQSVRHMCGPKKCETPPKPPCTDPCSELTIKKVDCGCDVYECKRKPTFAPDKCSINDEDKECKALLGECGKCEFEKTECETGEGDDRYHWERKCRHRPKTYQEPIPACNFTCMVPVLVPDDNPKCANRYQCEHKNKNTTEDPPKIVCEDKCKEAVLKKTEWNKEPWCGAKVWKCELQTEQSPDHPPSESCDETCDDACEKCVWEFNKECKRWKAKCRSKCTKHKQTLPAACYEPVEQDECGCPEEPRPKPCTQLPQGECPPGAALTRFKDVCGCGQTYCYECKHEWLEPECNDCEEVGPVEIVDGCPRQWCNPKKCPIPPEIECESCKKHVISEDPICGCPMYECKPKDCPEPEECEEGFKIGTKKDKCSCEINVCESVVVPITNHPHNQPLCGPDEDCEDKICTGEEICTKCVPKSFFRYFF